MRRKFSALFVLLILVAGLTAGIGPQPPSGALVLDLGGDIPETVPWNPLMAMFNPPEPTVIDKVMMLRDAAREDKIKGVVVRITTIEYDFAKAQEFRQAILRYKKKTGKPVFAYLELEGGGNLEFYLATACDKIYLSPASSMLVNGLASTSIYLGGLWPKIYVDMQVDKIKEYKTFGDMIGGREMSEAEREMKNAILDSLFDQFLTDIAAGRWTDKAKVKSWVDAAWPDSQSFVDAGAVDGIVYLDEVVKKIGGDQVSEEKFNALISARKAKMPGKRVAVIFAAGNIITGDAPTGPFSNNSVIASNPMVRKLEKAMEDKSIDAVIIRVDSGGGSALASDLIWDATQRLKAKKPVVISMSDVAGSGGYYIACGASSIVAQPGTITGSIGIVTAHPSIGRLLAKIGINTATMGRGEFADFGTMLRPMNEAELKKTHNSLVSLYNLFVKRVAEGRKLSPERVNEIGRGRVWTGVQAKEIGLVDKLGGFEEAIDEVRRLLNLGGDAEVSLIYGHERVTLWKLLTGRVEESVVERSLTRTELELVRELRLEGMWEPGQPLALMDSLQVR